jgi:hypothetical protein
MISFFQQGQIFSEALPFLHFCNKYDICNWYKLTSDYCFGKLYEINSEFSFNIGGLLSIFLS